MGPSYPFFQTTAAERAVDHVYSTLSSFSVFTTTGVSRSPGPKLGHASSLSSRQFWDDNGYNNLTPRNRAAFKQQDNSGSHDASSQAGLQSSTEICKIQVHSASVCRPNLERQSPLVNVDCETTSSLILVSNSAYCHNLELQNADVVGVHGRPTRVVTSQDETMQARSATAGVESCETTDSPLSSPLLRSVGQLEEVMQDAVASAKSCETLDSPLSSLVHHPKDSQDEVASGTVVSADCYNTADSAVPSAAHLCRMDTRTGSSPVRPQTNTVTQRQQLQGGFSSRVAPPSCLPLLTPSHSTAQVVPRRVVSFPAALTAAIHASNLMLLLRDATYRAEKNVKLCTGVPRNKRDELDGAGKVTSATKCLAIGVPTSEIVYDPSQAGGLLDKFDAMFADGSGIEIKASRSYRGDRSFQFSRLRPESPFQVCVCVCVC